MQYDPRGGDITAVRLVVPSRLIIMWQALRRPGRLHVCQHHPSIGVRVDGYADHVPNVLRPWQLVVHAVAGITGLPPSRSTCAPATYYLQNAAADTAGWESMSLGACFCNELHRRHTVPS